MKSFQQELPVIIRVLQWITKLFLCCNIKCCQLSFKLFLQNGACHSPVLNSSGQYVPGGVMWQNKLPNQVSEDPAGTGESAVLTWSL